MAQEMQKLRATFDSAVMITAQSQLQWAESQDSTATIAVTAS
jgi:hypothetical protein